MTKYFFPKERNAHHALRFCESYLNVHNISECALMNKIGIGKANMSTWRKLISQGKGRYIQNDVHQKLINFYHTLENPTPKREDGGFVDAAELRDMFVEHCRENEIEFAVVDGELKIRKAMWL